MTKGLRCTDAANATAGSDRETATTIPSRIFRCIKLPLEKGLRRAVQGSKPATRLHVKEVLSPLS